MKNLNKVFHCMSRQRSWTFRIAKTAVFGLSEPYFSSPALYSLVVVHVPSGVTLKNSTFSTQSALCILCLCQNKRRILSFTTLIVGTAVAQWLRCCATNWKSLVIGIFHWHNPSERTMALGSTQPLAEMSTRSISWEVKNGRCVRLTTLPPFSAIVT